MNRVAASLAAMMVIAGVLYRPSGPAPSIPTPTQPQSPQVGIGRTGAKSQAGSSECTENDGPWTAVQNSFESGTAKDSDQDLFTAAWAQPKAISETKALIATVADPTHTRLALYFDRSIDAIVEAASASGYELDRWWLPWNDKPPDDEPDCSWRLKARLERDRKENEPGLVIFRRRNQGKQVQPYLLVFLVGESPIYGVNKLQFADAVEHILAAWGNPSCLAPQKCEIGVVGPSFSGSVESLTVAIQAGSKAGNDKRHPPFFRVSSGWMTDRSAISRLRRNICYADPDPQSCLFGTTLEDDQTALNEFLAYLDSQHIHQNLALIAESETSYGVAIFDLKQSLSKLRNDLSQHFLPAIRQQNLARLVSPTPTAWFEFPRQISRLREAYELNPAINASPGDASKPVPRRLLPLILKDTPVLTEDVPPSFSKFQTPLSEELEMVGLTSELEHRRTQYVGLTSTDPLDMLFLIRLLQRTNPDIQLFVLDSDLLFLRAQDEVPPEGLLAVTSYPMFLRSRYWSKENNRLFPSRYAEAMYNACLLLLDRPDQVLDSAKPIILSEYSERNPQVRVGAAGFDPPLWLMTVGREGYLPVSVLDASLPSPSAGHGDEALPRTWILLWGMVTGFAAIHVVAFVLAQFWNRLWLENFRLADKSRPYALGQALHLLVATLSLGLIEVVLVLPARRVYRLTVWPRSLSCLIGTALTITALCLFYVALKHGFAAWQSTKPNRWVRLRLQRLWGVRNELSCVVLALVALAASLWFCWWWWKIITSNDYYSVFFDYRSVQLASAVSPALPLLLLLAALYVWSWTHLLRLAQTLRRPRVVNVDPSFASFETNALAAFVDLIYNWKLQAVLAGLFSCGFVLAKPSRGAISFETTTFSDCYLALLVVISWLMFSSLVRFCFVWNQLKNILRRLEQLRFREAFDRLPKPFSWSPIWQQGGTRRSYKILTRSLDCLTKLAATLVAADPLGLQLAASLADAQNRAQVITDHEAQQICSTEAELESVQNSLKQTGETVANYLQPMWAGGASDSATREEGENLTKKSREANFRGDLTRILAEEFLALRYVAYIRSTCIEMRYMLFFISTAFILSLISVKSYAFQAHHAMGWLLTAIFLVLGVAIVKVFAEMERDSVLSRLSATQPGRLSPEFFIRIFSFGALPLFTVIAAQFPAVARFFFSWVQPGLLAFK